MSPDKQEQIIHPRTCYIHTPCNTTCACSIVNIQLCTHTYIHVHTCLLVGFLSKKLLLVLSIGGLTLGLRNTHPCAMASSGAGPSYGKPRPMKSLDCWNGKGATDHSRGGRTCGHIRSHEVVYIVLKVQLN